MASRAPLSMRRLSIGPYGTAKIQLNFWSQSLLQSYFRESRLLEITFLS